MKKYVYQIKDSETNNFEMDEFDNLKDAKLKIKEYEKEDEENGWYEPNSYEIIRNLTEEYKKELVNNVFDGYIEEKIWQNDSDNEYKNDKIVIDLNVFDEHCKIETYTRLSDNDYFCHELEKELNQMLQQKFEENGYAIYIDIYPENGRFKNVNPNTIVVMIFQNF